MVIMAANQTRVVKGLGKLKNACPFLFFTMSRVHELPPSQSCVHHIPNAGRRSDALSCHAHVVPLDDHLRLNNDRYNMQASEVSQIYICRFQSTAVCCAKLPSQS